MKLHIFHLCGGRKRTRCDHCDATMAATNRTQALPALPAPRERRREASVLTSAATNDETAEPPEKEEPLWKKFGEAGVIAYVGINVFWYAIGVNLFLRGMPIKQAGGAKLAYKRFLAAWGLCFAASHSLGPILPAVRAAGAGALSPLSSALLSECDATASAPRGSRRRSRSSPLRALRVLSFFTLDGARARGRGGVI